MDRLISSVRCFIHILIVFIVFCSRYYCIASVKFVFQVPCIILQLRRKCLEFRPHFGQIITDNHFPAIAELGSQNRTVFKAAVNDILILCKVYLSAKPDIRHGFLVTDTDLQVRMCLHFLIGCVKLYRIKIQYAVFFKLEFQRTDLGISIQSKCSSILQRKLPECLYNNIQPVFIIQ